MVKVSLCFARDAISSGERNVLASASIVSLSRGGRRGYEDMKRCRKKKLKLSEASTSYVAFRHFAARNISLWAQSSLPHTTGSHLGNPTGSQSKAV